MMSGPSNKNKNKKGQWRNYTIEGTVKIKN